MFINTIERPVTLALTKGEAVVLKEILNTCITEKSSGVHIGLGQDLVARLTKELGVNYKEVFRNGAYR